jgi:hypothetical protein
MKPKSDKVKAITTNNTGGLDYILVNGTKLGEINQDLPFLPNGIINKGVTGIGATTMEIEAPRHSIIIQPLKVTAQSKSLKHKELIFFDSNTPSKQLFKQLEAREKDDKFPFKKIILVIDNLKKLIKELGTDFLEYFMLFDEIDFMQGSSTYRSAIEEGVDIAKKHKNFAFITATYLEHSDPELASLPITTFKYESPEPLNLNVYYVSWNETARIKFKTTLNRLYSYLCKELPINNCKFLVAINSVYSIEKVAKALVDGGIISSGDISINISQGIADNNELISKYSGKLIEQDKLPCKLNFISSAYFNGYDIIETEPYQLILFSSPIKEGLLLTPHEILQIYGRNRNKNGVSSAILFIHDIVQSELSVPEFIDFTQQDWLEFAGNQLNAAKCEFEHNAKYLSTKNNEQALSIQKLFQIGFEQRVQNSYTFTRLRNENALGCELDFEKMSLFPAISYFKIDYWIHYYNALKTSALSEYWNFINEDKTEVETELFSFELSYVHEKLAEYNIQASFYRNKIPFLKIEQLKKSFKEMVLESLEIIKKTKLEDNLKPFSGLTNKIYQVYELGRKHFNTIILTNCIKKLKNKKELELLLAYLKSITKDEHSLFLYALKNQGLKENIAYSTGQLGEIIIQAYLSLNRPMLKGATLSLQKIRLILGIYFKLQVSSEGVAKKGQKYYKLKPYNPFPSLVKK